MSNNRSNSGIGDNIKTYEDLFNKRKDTNKHLSMKEQLEMDGIYEKDFIMRQEFYKLRGEQGIIKTRVELDLDA